ncbi:MAG TPA: hypothetical protein VK475_05230, partial [Pyrinomonadaceae bacterium]|nr:hypothetical protein [Pyrinomonadaceae bacterium]
MTLREFISGSITRLLPQAVPYRALPYPKVLVPTLGLAILCLALLPRNASGQTPTPTPPQTPGDIIRVNTELVQTGVMVFDKQGHFVEGLRREQFELSVDGKPQPISFFEQVKAGTSRERAQLVAASNNSAPAEKTTPINDSRG